MGDVEHAGHEVAVSVEFLEETIIVAEANGSVMAISVLLKQFEAVTSSTSSGRAKVMSTHYNLVNFSSFGIFLSPGLQVRNWVER